MKANLGEFIPERSSEDNGKTMGWPSEDYGMARGKTMRRQWEDRGRAMGSPWETMERLWECHGKAMGRQSASGYGGSHKIFVTHGLPMVLP